jgi:hypothetical protein
MCAQKIDIARLMDWVCSRICDRLALAFVSESVISWTKTENEKQELKKEREEARNMKSGRNARERKAHGINGLREFLF